MNPRTNGLLADLPEAELEFFAPHLKLISLSKGQTLFSQGDDLSFVYYPVGAIISLMIDNQSGDSTESFMLGKSCMVGAATLEEPSFYRAQVRHSGLAYALPVSVLLQAREHCPAYFRNAMKSVNRMVMQLTQAVFCSKRHGLEQQLIRWLLVNLDRGVGDTIEVTHQEIAELLGFRREAITMALKKMTERNEVVVHRGLLEVLDRQSLEARSCDCYWAATQRQRPVSHQLASSA
jgi:CRP-like cAMP-binding protein